MHQRQQPPQTQRQLADRGQIREGQIPENFALRIVPQIRNNAISVSGFTDRQLESFIDGMIFLQNSQQLRQMDINNEQRIEFKQRAEKELNRRRAKKLNKTDIAQNWWEIKLPWWVRGIFRPTAQVQQIKQHKNGQKNHQCSQQQDQPFISSQSSQLPVSGKKIFQNDSVIASVSKKNHKAMNKMD